MEDQHLDEAQSTLQFFDDVFNAIPPSFRQIDKADLVKSKPKKEKPMSLFDLHEGVQGKIKEMQRENREKSLKRIAELTLMH